MPPKRIGGQQKGFLKSTYSALTAPENASVVRSIAMFGVRLSHPPSCRKGDSIVTNIRIQAAVALISSSFADSLIGSV